MAKKVANKVANAACCFAHTSTDCLVSSKGFFSSHLSRKGTLKVMKLIDLLYRYSSSESVEALCNELSDRQNALRAVKMSQDGLVSAGCEMAEQGHRVIFPPRMLPPSPAIWLNRHSS